MSKIFLMIKINDCLFHIIVYYPIFYLRLITSSVPQSIIDLNLFTREMYTADIY